MDNQNRINTFYKEEKENPLIFFSIKTSPKPVNLTFLFIQGHSGCLKESTNNSTDIDIFKRNANKLIFYNAWILNGPGQRAPSWHSSTWITALQNSREFMNWTRAGSRSQSSFRRQCHSSPFSSSFVGREE